MKQTMQVMEGVKVVEASQWVMGPSAAAILAQWGAEVVRIEHPTLADPLRAVLPTQGLDATFDFYIENNNHSKRSIGLDLSSGEGREIFLRLVQDADVFITSVLEPARQKWQITYDELRTVNPQLIYARSHGQGARGPEAYSPGYDVVSYWARSSAGYMATPEGEKSSLTPANGFGDVQGGLALVAGIAAALLRRTKSGEGALVDVSLLGVGMWDMYESIQFAAVYNSDPKQYFGELRKSSKNPLTGTYETADNRVISLCMVQTDRYWPQFCTALGWRELIDDPRFNSFQSRVNNGKELVDMITGHFLHHDLDDLCERLFANGCAFAAYRTPSEVPQDPQVQANGYLMPHPTHADRFVVSSPIEFDGKPACVKRPAPEPGQHTEEILLELNYSWDDIASFKDLGVIT